MNRFQCLVFVSHLMVGVLPAFSQDDLEIFGYFQANYQENRVGVTTSNSALNIRQESKDKNNSFVIQQINLFLKRDLGSNFTAWMNFELTNSYSSDKNWGSFNLEEAWMKYGMSNAFNVKAGLLIPTFNNLNEVKNRMPYLPYISRPVVYEASLSELLKPSDYLPERANVQVYGAIPAGGAKVEYAAYVGNSETDDINSGVSVGLAVRGLDTTSYKTVGGRLGLKMNNLKLGVSAAFDRDNQNATGLGNVKRTKLGADLSVTEFGFTFEGELISVQHDLSTPGVDLDKSFYYGTLTYDFTQSIFGYVSYSFIKDKANPVLVDGVQAYFVGGGYRPTSRLTLKAQYIIVKIDDGQVPVPGLPFPLKFELDLNQLLLGVSVFF